MSFDELLRDCDLPVQEQLTKFVAALRDPIWETHDYARGVQLETPYNKYPESIQKQLNKLISPLYVLDYNHQHIRREPLQKCIVHIHKKYSGQAGFPHTAFAQLAAKIGQK